MPDESFKIDQKNRERTELKEVSDTAGAYFVENESKSARNSINEESNNAHNDAANVTPKSFEQQISDEFEVLELIGQGATGHVYKVRNKTSNAILAIKVLRKNLLGDIQTVKRFNQEAAAAAGLTHANVVSVYSAGETKDGAPYITMNYIDGESFATVLKKTAKLELQRAIDLFLQICEGLEAAHSQGLIHRDLKPSNIIIDKSESGIERAHLVDFGIAKIVASSGDTLSTLTASGDFLGTPTYMSPEQCLGKNVDNRTDIYALGCMFFEAVSGSSPYAGSSPVEVIAKKMSEQSPVLQQAPTVSPALSMIVACCMASDPASRYESVSALKSDLIALSEDREPKQAMAKFGLGKTLAGKRLAAWFIDNIVISTANGIIGFIPIIALAILGSALSSHDTDHIIAGLLTTGFYFILPAILWTLYSTWFESKRGATLGKQLLKLSVCDLYGNRLSMKTAFLRNFYKVAFLMVITAASAIGFCLLPNAHQSGYTATAIAFVLAVAFCLYSRKVHHQMPWDVWARSQVRQR